MNTTEHLIACLAEEGSEIAQDAMKSLRFGLQDRNVLNPTGPTNQERLVNELNDLLGVAEMLVTVGALPPDWQSAAKQQAKREKVARFMAYAIEVGALQDTTTLQVQ